MRRVTKTKTMKIDIMKPLGGGHEKWIATLKYTYSKLWKFDAKVFYDWIIKQRPSLEGKPITVYTDDKYLKTIYFHQDIGKVMREEMRYR